MSLHEAAKSGWAHQAMQKLLKETVDPNTLDREGNTPLMHAVERGHEETVQVLLRANDVNPNTTDVHGWTPLRWAACRGRTKIVQLLLQTESIDPNLGDESGSTPLIVASKDGYVEVVELLLQAKDINLNAKDRHGESALSHAAKHGRAQVLRVLLGAQGIDLQIQSRNGRTPLSYAAEANEHEEIVQLLLHVEGIEPNCPDKYGRTPLSYAAERGHKEIVRLLLQTKGIEINYPDKNGWTPLAHAAGAEWTQYTHIGDKKHEEVVQLLLQVDGIEPNSPDKDGQTPFSHAAEHGCEEIVQLLLQTKGIEINCPDKNGRTPLSYAVEHGHRTIVQLLLQTSGIDATASRAPLSFAVEQGSAALIRMLVDFTRSHDRTAISWAAEHGHIACIEPLLQTEHMDPSSKDPGGRTPLLRALENGHESVVRYLAPLDSITLHMLVQEGLRDLVQQLLKIRPDVVDTKDSRGQTSLHIAIRYGWTDVVGDLIAYNAGIDSQRSDGLTPLLLAIQLKDKSSIKKLLGKGAEVTRISIEDWFEAYGIDAQRISASQSIAAELLEDADNAKRLCFSERKPADVLTDTGESRILLSLYTRSKSMRKSNVQSLLAACPGSMEFLRNSHTAAPAFHMFSKEIKSNKDNLIYLAIRFPIGNPSQSKHFLAHWDLCAIAWTIVPPTQEENGPDWRSVAHVSMLPNGWIPKDGVEFFQHFMCYLQERWMELCDLGEEHMSYQRLRQLQEKGKSYDLIQHLAEDAQEWDRLRRVLRFEVLSTQEFAKKHFRQYNASKATEAQEAIESFSKEVGNRLSLLDQTIRDLLQFEFAWASINEAHKSTSLATSMKRLSWITLIIFCYHGETKSKLAQFVFLPVMFASSLFGMNVDILASNPDWRWYILFVSIILAITILGWLLFKYGQIEQWTERHIGARFSRLGKVRRDQGSGKEDADPRF